MLLPLPRFRGAMKSHSRCPVCDLFFPGRGWRSQHWNQQINTLCFLQDSAWVEEKQVLMRTNQDLLEKVCLGQSLRP